MLDEAEPFWGTISPMIVPLSGPGSVESSVDAHSRLQVLETRRIGAVGVTEPARPSCGGIVLNFVKVDLPLFCVLGPDAIPRARHSFGELFVRW